MSATSYAVLTLGCRVNQADSLMIEGELLARGAVAVDPTVAELVVVNTCSVTASADQAARQLIRRIGRDNPAAVVVVTGCYATRRPDDLRALGNVAHVVANRDKHHLLALAGQQHRPTGATEAAESTAVRFGDGDYSCGAMTMPGVAGRTAFTLRVQTGCDERCSYCIIPSTRGAARSRAVDDVMRDVDRALAAGYKEIAITGVHLGSFGRDRVDGESLTELIRRLAARSEDVMFRVSSLEPMDCTPEIVDLIAASPRLAPHFHLPLQHAHDEMLSAMRRPYTAAFYRDLVTGIRARIPHAAIGSDIIVGFPGEEDRHFLVMRDIVRELPLTHLHVFPYSDRPGTEASRMPGKVDGADIRARGREMRAIGAQLAGRFRASLVGTAHRALVVDDGRSAVTGNYLKVTLERRYERNEWVEVVIGADGRDEKDRGDEKEGSDGEKEKVFS